MEVVVEDGPSDKAASETITVTAEEGKTVEEQALAWGRERWPGKEVSAFILGEFDENGKLGNTKNRRPAWAPELSAVTTPTSHQTVSLKEQVNRARENLKLLEDKLREQTRNCKHKFLEPVKDGAYWIQECSICDFTRSTNKTEKKIVDVPDFD